MNFMRQIFRVSDAFSKLFHDLLLQLDVFMDSNNTQDKERHLKRREMVFYFYAPFVLA
jgi:hypothetical protein